MLITMTQTASAGTLKVMLTGRANNSYFDKVIAQYQKTHKGTRITPIYMKWEDQAEAIAKKPDVFVGPRYFLADNIEIGIFEDLNKLLSKETIKSFHSELLYSCSIKKQIYGVPVFGYGTSLVYNKDMFKKAGLSAPDTSWSWEGKFQEACRKLTQNRNGDGTNERFGFVGLPTNNFLSLFYGFGGSFHNTNVTKVTYTEKPGMDAINFILKLHKEKIVELVDWSTVTDGEPQTYPFVNGRSAMEINWVTSLGDNGYEQWFKRNKIDMRVGNTVIPSGPKGTISAVDSDVVTMMSTCKNKKEAADFIKFMASSKGQEMIYDIYGALPTTNDGLRLEKVTRKVAAPFLKSYRLGKGRNIRRQVGHLEGRLWGDLTKILNNEGTMSDLMANSKTALDDFALNL